MGRAEAAYTAIFPATLATAACPVTVLSCGRKLHDRTAANVMTKGAATCHHGRPVAADATAAPVRSKRSPHRPIPSTMENAGEESRSLRESSRLPEGQQNRPEKPDPAPLVEPEDFAADLRSEGIAKHADVFGIAFHFGVHPTSVRSVAPGKSRAQHF